MRREQNDRLAGVELSAQFFRSLDADHAFQAGTAAPPEKTAFQHGTRQYLKVASGERFTRL